MIGESQIRELGESDLSRFRPLTWGRELLGSLFPLVLIAVGVRNRCRMLGLSVLTIIMGGGGGGLCGRYITMINPVFDYLMGVARLIKTNTFSLINESL